MSFLNDLIGDLREKRLWPVALVLVGALVAVPVLLAKPAPKVPIASAATPPSGGAAPPGLPVVSVASAPSNARLHGHARDPFKQQGASSHTTTTATTSTTSTTSSPGSSTTGGTSTTGTGGTATGGGTASTGGGTTTGTGGTGGTSNTGGTTSPTIPLSPAKPAPTGLTATEAYGVTIAITQPGGDLTTIDPVERLSQLPSRSVPALLELGVLQGGSRVLFAVRPGTILGGPGRCIPGRIDCQILVLSQNQIETVSLTSATGPVQLAQFAVTAIYARHYPNPNAGATARLQTAPLGERFLRGDHLSALEMFPYDPKAGVILDRRNLSAGGN
jgi:hypothetical protein